MNIGNNIRKIRQSKGLTQKDLADMLGKTPQYVSKLEKNINSLNFTTINSLADALGVSIYELQGVKWMVTSMDRLGEVKEQKEVLLNLYDQLNELGKDKAIERVEELTELKKYTDKD